MWLLWGALGALGALGVVVVIGVAVWMSQDKQGKSARRDSTGDPGA